MHFDSGARHVHGQRVSESAFELVTQGAARLRHCGVPFQIVGDAHPTGVVQFVEYVQREDDSSTRSPTDHAYDTMIFRRNGLRQCCVQSALAVWW